MNNEKELDWLIAEYSKALNQELCLTEVEETDDDTNDADLIFRLKEIHVRYCGINRPSIK